MPIRCHLVAGFACVGLLLAAPCAWATMDNLKSLKQAYPGKDAKIYSCKTCHLGAIGKKGELNPYGQALDALKEKGSDTKKLTTEDFKAVESQDSDGDGVSNGDELNAGTNPGDAPKTSWLDVVMPNAWAADAAPPQEEKAPAAAKSEEKAPKAEKAAPEPVAKAEQEFQ